jgi:hypothetical protein
MDNRASIPPPPYSETDTNASVILTPPASHYDNAAVTISTLPSLASDTSAEAGIYTPSPSPSPSEYQHPELQAGYAVSPSAAAFFESRPLLDRRSAQPITDHNITVSSETDHGDLPYLEELASHDVTQQDWATFLNHLLPEHIVNVNYDIADRKLRAEMMNEQM